MVYVSGFFSTIAGQSRFRLAALDATTGAVTAWNPGITGLVNQFALAGNSIYVGGFFTAIGGQNRKNIAALDRTTGAATAWDPAAGDSVAALGVSGGVVYAGGGFRIIGGVKRANLAAIDATTGMATAWNPGASGPSDSTLINVLKVHDTTVYAGGRFTTIGGQSRERLAALSTTTGAVNAWNPAPDGTVTTLEISGTTVYVGGQYTTIGGQNRNNLAAVDATTGNATSWRPNNSTTSPTQTDIGALLVRDSTIYIGDECHRQAAAYRQGSVPSPTAAAYLGAPAHRLAPRTIVLRPTTPPRESKRRLCRSSKPARKHTPGVSWRSCSLAAVDSHATTRRCAFPAKPLISFNAPRPQHPHARRRPQRESLKLGRPRWARAYGSAVNGVMIS